MVPALPLLLTACGFGGEVGEPVVLNDDGGWCWFQDERALGLGEVVVVGSVAAGRHDPQRRGDIELTFWTPSTGETRRVELHDRLELDDHDAPALLRTDDGGLLAMYAKHGSDHLMRWRRGDGVNEGAVWSEERSLAIQPDAPMGVTYANLHRGARPGRVLNLFRGPGWDPNLAVSDDGGSTWRWIGQVLGGPGRPYLKYASAGDGTIHMIATEQHPRDFDNSLYHGLLRGRSVESSDGTPVGEVGEEPPPPEALTRVFAGGPDAVAWPCDVEVDPKGRAVCVFTTQADGADERRGSGGADHRFHYARLGGGGWRVHEIAFAGTRLYAGEDDYTGLAAIDPAETMTVYLSTDAHPASGEPLISETDGLRHRELFRARSKDEGATWEFEALTRDSDTDQLRPVVPPGSPRVLLWLRGTMTSYTDYAFEVVGIAL
ncbi:MAG: BNR-4 repeat-containing protein [Planctomycetota bacterium]|jgi:hypothetical protein|nr:BNR-4 repeat-containing protein [Planctomycetota bacterium]MDP6989294.1 BNR-4 repeat-containing protein [Planctomycetota bacterium]